MDMEDYDLGFIFGLFGEYTSRILLYLNRFKESYATEIARQFCVKQQTIQYHMDKLEAIGILKSRIVGRTRLYRINPRYVLRKELGALLDKTIDYLPEEVVQEHFVKRTRPRTKGKALRKYED
jgi:DNA-binding transcriptional ArsR family regulator